MERSDEPSEQLRVLQREMSMEWEISDFFSKPEESRLNSSSFALFDSQWDLVIHPNGSEKLPGWISLYLRKIISRMRYTINFEMGIKEQNGSIYRSFKGNVVTTGELCSGEDAFLKRTELWNSRADVAPDDTIRVYCIMRLVDDGHDIKEYSSIKLRKYVCLETVSENLKDLYLSGRRSDVIIKVMDKEFKAHKSILSARSPVLSEIIERKNLENGGGVITLKDCDPIAFQHYLFFLYSGNIEDISYDVAYNLYKIAEKYKHPPLQEECVTCISRGLSVDSFCDILRIAVKHNEKELRKMTTEFFVKNTLQILPMNKWLSFVEDHHSVANELFISVTVSKQNNNLQ